MKRFKTKEEFIRDGQWVDSNNTPQRWNSYGEMNHFMGKVIHEDTMVDCGNDSFSLRGEVWTFKDTDTVDYDETHSTHIDSKTTVTIPSDSSISLLAVNQFKELKIKI